MQGSREQLAIAEFASALLSIPKTLAINAATGDPKKAYSRYGLDLMGGYVRDNVHAGVLEPTMGKVKSLKSAYEAAVALLRIDDAIQCVPGKAKEEYLRDITYINHRTKK